MAVCPKGSYALVLLPKRGKYKYAKCSGLHPKKFIGSKEFCRRNEMFKYVLLTIS